MITTRHFKRVYAANLFITFAIHIAIVFKCCKILVLFEIVISTDDVYTGIHNQKGVGGGQSTYMFNSIVSRRGQTVEPPGTQNRRGRGSGGCRTGRKFNCISRLRLKETRQFVNFKRSFRCLDNGYASANE